MMLGNDITKCRGEDCPLKATCIRFTTPSDSMWQSYFTEVPYNEETESCDHYWKGKTELKSRSKEDVSKRSNNRTESKTGSSKIKTNTKTTTKKIVKKITKFTRSK